MHYLITGGAGFIGKNLTEQLDHYKVLDRRSVTNPYDICKGIPNSNTDILVHLAALTDVRRSLSYPTSCIQENILTTLNCLTFATQKSIKKLVFTSSIGARSPISPYTASKSACEAICDAYSNSYNLNIVKLILSNVYGPHSLGKTSVIASFIRSILQEKPMTVYGSGKQKRDFVYVLDVVKSIINSKHSQVISTGTQVSINEIVQILNELSKSKLGYTVEVNYEPEVKGEIHSMPVEQGLLNHTKIEQGLGLTFNWFLENY